MGAGEIFVSYSRRDREYVTALVAFLRGEGLDVWVDHEIATGERWDRTLRERIDNCAAFILVMSPDADESTWVGEEIDRARAKGKPILPLLLSGEVFFGFSRTQYDDVSGGQLPGRAFVDRLLRLAGPGTPPVPSAQGGAEGTGGAVLLSTVDGHEDAVTAVSYSPRASALASGSRDHTIRTWPAGGYGQLQVLRRHTDTVWSLAFTGDGLHLVSAGADGSVVVWRRADGAVEHELRGHTGVVHSVSARPLAASQVASGGEDATVVLWPLTGGSGPEGGRITLSDIAGPVRAVAYSPDGRRLAVGGRGEPHLRDAGTGTRTLDLAVSDAYSTTGLAWSPDSRLVAAAGDDGVVRVYEADHGTLVRAIRCHSGRIYAVAWSPDGRRLATAGLTGVARIWRAGTGDLVDTLSGHSGRVFAVAWSPHGDEVATGSGDRTTRLWRV